MNNMKSTVKKKLMAMVGLVLLVPLVASAQPETKQQVKPITIYEWSWNGRFAKVCIGDQFYLVGVNSYGPSAITPALREGKPEQCEQTLPGNKNE